jgi:hypothetical protein
MPEPAQQQGDPTQSPQGQSNVNDQNNPGQSGNADPGQGDQGQKGSGSILDDGANGDGKKQDPASDDGKKVVPEKYEPFNLGEGLELNEQAFGEFSELAKGLQLSQEQAQSLVDFQAKLVQENHQAQLQKSNDVVEAWKQETLKMMGDSLPQQRTIANKALNQRPELKAVLVDTGLINHPEVMKLVVDFGRATSEDILHDGNSGPTKKLPPEKILYGDSKN